MYRKYTALHADNDQNLAVLVILAVTLNPTTQCEIVTILCKGS